MKKTWWAGDILIAVAISVVMYGVGGATKLEPAWKLALSCVLLYVGFAGLYRTTDRKVFVSAPLLICISTGLIIGYFNPESMLFYPFVMCACIGLMAWIRHGEPAV